MNLPEAIPHRPEADNFDLRRAVRQVVQATRAYKWIVALTVVLTMGLAGLYVWIWPPIYKADVLIVADAKEDLSRDSFYQIWNVFRKDSLASEVEMMTSRGVLRKVVSQLDLKFDDVYHPFLLHAAYLWTESWPGKRYKALKEWVFPPEPSPYKPTKEEEEFAKTVEAFRSGVALQAVAESTAGYLRVRGPSPRVAEIANKLIDVYLDERRRRHLEEATKAHDALAVEVARAHEDLIDVESRKQKFAEENGMLLDFEKDKVEVARALDVEAGVIELKALIASTEKNRAEVLAQLGQESRENVSQRTYQQNALRESLKATRMGLLTALDQARMHYRADAPEVIDITRQIASVEEKIAGEEDRVEVASVVVLSPTHEELRGRLGRLDAELAGARANLAVKERALAEVRDRVNRLPLKMQVAHALSREHQMAEQKYGILHERLMMAEVSMATIASAPSSMRVADYASPPSKKSWPNTKVLFVAAGVVGLGAGIGLAFLLDMLRGRVTRDKLAISGVEFPVYAVLDLPGERGVSRISSRAGLISAGREGNG
jgi:uncharacterized protein involved in exopolysaccharide biosynthesis